MVVIASISMVVDWYRKPNIADFSFSAQNLKTVSNQTIDLKNLSESNQTLLVYVWGSWCGICRYTSPAVEKLYQEGVPAIGIALESGNKNEVVTYMHNKGLTFPVLNDEHGASAQQWGVQVTPTMLWVKHGKVVHSSAGISSYLGLKLRTYLSDWLL